MKKMKLNTMLLVFLFASCASNGSLENKHQAVKSPEGFTSPNQKIDVELLVQKTESSSPEAAFTRGVFRPGAIVPQHSHEVSDEYITFEKGEGEITIGSDTYFVKDGDSFYIPKGTQHSYVNRGTKEAKFYQVYSPAGPEQRFKKWSKLKGL